MSLKRICQLLDNRPLCDIFWHRDTQTVWDELPLTIIITFHLLQVLPLHAQGLGNGSEWHCQRSGHNCSVHYTSQPSELPHSSKGKRLQFWDNLRDQISPVQTRWTEGPTEASHNYHVCLDVYRQLPMEKCRLWVEYKQCSCFLSPPPFRLQCPLPAKVRDRQTGWRSAESNKKKRKRK